jgi:hypothetical protein
MTKQIIPGAEELEREIASFHHSIDTPADGYWAQRISDFARAHADDQTKAIHQVLPWLQDYQLKHPQLAGLAAVIKICQLALSGREE